MTLRAGSKADVTDFALPDVVTATGSGTNTVVATSFAVLPTTTCTAEILNPHPSASMLVRVDWGAQMSASANAVRCCPAVSGSVTVAPGVGGGGAAGWGEIPIVASSLAVPGRGSFTVELPASGNPAVFSIHAYRDSASGTQQVDHPTIRLTPLRFVF